MRVVCLAKTQSNPYRIKLTIVRIMVVVMLDVEVDVSVGGGGGDAAPGEDIVPPNAETASAMLTIATAHVWRRVFTWVPPKKMQNFAYPKIMQNFCVAP